MRSFHCKTCHTEKVPSLHWRHIILEALRQLLSVLPWFFLLLLPASALLCSLPKLLICLPYRAQAGTSKTSTTFSTLWCRKIFPPWWVASMLSTLSSITVWDSFFVYFCFFIFTFFFFKVKIGGCTHTPENQIKFLKKACNNNCDWRKKPEYNQNLYM